MAQNFVFARLRVRMVLLTASLTSQGFCDDQIGNMYK